MQWYSYTDENGYTKYEYREGEMSDEDKAKYKDLKDLGYCFFDYNNQVYYSLFGVKWSWNESSYGIVQIYNILERLLIGYMSKESIEQERKDQLCQVQYVNTYASSLRLGTIAFKYRGLSFDTIESDPTGYGNQFWNVKEDKAKAVVYQIPTSPEPGLRFSHTKNGYLFRAANSIGTDNKKGFTVMRVTFDKENAEKFINSCNAIFGQNYKMEP